ncbi:MAG: hypothetical protein ACXU8N_06215 [Telluria sp.]
MEKKLQNDVVDQRAALHRNELRAELAQQAEIPGWGADLDEANRPGYPMERTPPRLDNVHWDQPEQQHMHVPVFYSPERPGMTPVFGSTCPPRGLSGLMRSAAYRMTENDIRHWLLLLAADRVDVVEGIADDLMHGHIPNIFAEMGIRAELKHNPKGLVKKAAVTGLVAGLAYYWLKGRKR